MKEKPAVLGGTAVFKNTVPIVKPPIKPHITSILADFDRILKSGMITNFEYVKKLEKTAANYVGTKHCVVTGNCTSALILVLEALKLKNAEILLPSFTFPATAHAAHRAGLRIGLVDCDPESFTVDVSDLRDKITEKTKAIMPVHAFGNPCAIKQIEEIARDHSLHVVYDAAQAFGAKYRGKSVGQFGDAEVFSGSPTKAFTTVEGGIVTTDSADIAREVEIGRNYGHAGDYNCEFPGLSARMSELHAAVGLNLMPHVDSDIQKRNRIAQKYRQKLGKLTGIGFQEITPSCLSTYKDFGILVDKDGFGLSRDELATALEKENIATRKYFYPPLHMQDCYPLLKAGDKAFPNTSSVARKVLCLPMFSELTDKHLDGIVQAISRIQDYASEVRHTLLEQKAVASSKVVERKLY